MSKEVAIILTIVILVALLITFIVTFALYKKTPVPAGCENLKINEENCTGCNNTQCEHFRSREDK